MSELADALLGWYDRHGRHDLPWQKDVTAYRVWVSEIMLQQTQVKTVVPYFERFTARFPNVARLGAAAEDAVLNVWSGLGYYARARNLHRAARIIMREHQGEFPDDFERLVSLPGIGRSTAGAILALAHGQRHPILDGNVKRVLCRYHAVEEWPGKSAVTRVLWELADQHTPSRRVAAYTQAIMDLGATLCTRSAPACLLCPLAAGCNARASGRQTELPAAKPSPHRPTRETQLVIVRDHSGRVLLEKRPPSGVWGGLWSFPECDLETDAGAWCLEALGLSARDVHRLSMREHGFTHFQLRIHPVVVQLAGRGDRIMEGGERVWYKDPQREGVGLAAPIADLIRELQELAGPPQEAQPGPAQR